MSNYGPFLLALLHEAAIKYPGDLEAQALYVRQAMIAKRNERVTAAAAAHNE